MHMMFENRPYKTRSPTCGLLLIYEDLSSIPGLSEKTAFPTALILFAISKHVASYSSVAMLFDNTIGPF